MSNGWIAASLCFLLFAVGIFFPFSYKQRPIVKIETFKPTVPSPVIVRIENPFSLLPLSKKSEVATHHFGNILNHPWVQLQQEVSEISIEMVRDIEAFEQLCENLSERRAEKGESFGSKEEFSNKITQLLKKMQSSVPFKFPSHLYNVLCIPESLHAPFAFQVLQRIYLGETELGLPFYLDVRVFNLENEHKEAQIEAIQNWHFNLLEGGRDVFKKITSNSSFYLGEGKYSAESNLGHGFEISSGLRGIYLSFFEKENILYVAYASAPLLDFKKMFFY